MLFYVIFIYSMRQTSSFRGLHGPSTTHFWIIFFSNVKGLRKHKGDHDTPMTEMFHYPWRMNIMF